MVQSIPPLFQLAKPFDTLGGKIGNVNVEVDIKDLDFLEIAAVLEAFNLDEEFSTIDFPPPTPHLFSVFDAAAWNTYLSPAMSMSLTEGRLDFWRSRVKSSGLDCTYGFPRVSSFDIVSANLFSFAVAHQRKSCGSECSKCPLSVFEESYTHWKDSMFTRFDRFHPDR